MEIAPAALALVLGTVQCVSSWACQRDTITRPVPFMGNDGEVFVLSDGSVWEVKYEYEYLYEYYPSVTICPDEGILIVDGKKLQVEPVSGAAQKKPSTEAKRRSEIVESRVDGSWEGWQGETIVKLVNGKVWEQVGLHLSLSLKLSPKVLLFQRGGSYYMQVEGESEAVEVRALN